MSGDLLAMLLEASNGSVFTISINGLSVSGKASDVCITQNPDRILFAVTMAIEREKLPEIDFSDGPTMRILNA
jgi:hypothetical protein